MASSDSLLIRWMRTSLVLGVLVGGATLAYFVWPRPHGDIATIARLVPAEVSSATFVRDLDRWLQVGVGVANQPDARPELKEWFQHIRDQGQSQAGFDPTDVRAWKQAGFDPGGIWGMLSLGSDPQKVQILFFAPVRDEAKALETIQKYTQARGGKIESKIDAGRTIYSVSWPEAERLDKVGAFTFASSYWIGCDPGMGTLDASGVLSGLLAHQPQPSLNDSDSFRGVLDALGSGWTALFFSSPAVTTAVARDYHLDQSPLLQGLGSRGTGISIELSEARLRFKLRVLNDPSVPKVPGLAIAHETASKQIPGEPIAVARLSFDLPALAALLQKDPKGRADFDKLSQAVQQNYGLDLEQDVVENLDGQLSGVMLNAQSSAGLPVDGVLTVGVRDEQRAATALDHLAATLRRQGLPLDWEGSGNERWTRVFAFGGGLSHGRLWVVSGSSRLTSLQKALNDGAQLGYLSALPEPVQKDFTSGPSIYAWVDPSRLGKSLEVPGQARTSYLQQVGKQLGTISLGIDGRSSMLSADLDFFAPAGGFGAVLHDAAKADPNAQPTSAPASNPNPNPMPTPAPSAPNQSPSSSATP
jgi:hypothetical protein